MSDKKELNRGILGLGLSLLDTSAKDYGVVWATEDGEFSCSSTNRTWFLGALRRAIIGLEEQERLDQQQRGSADAP